MHPKEAAPFRSRTNKTTRFGRFDKAKARQIQLEMDTSLTASPSSPLAGKITAPGDKSISHRALIFGAMADGTTEITGLLEGADVLATAQAMRQLGAQVEHLSAGHWRLHGVGAAGFSLPDQAIDFGNSGTAARLVMGAMTGHAVIAQLAGDASLSARPMGRVIAPLSLMGAWQGKIPNTDRLPLRFEGAEKKQARAIEYQLPVPSAQVKSAVLLAGLGAQGKTTVIEDQPTRDHTERMLALFGAPVTRHIFADGSHHISIAGPQTLTATKVAVPGDPSSAAFAAVATLITGGSDILIENVLLNEYRTGLYRSLIDMGGHIDFMNERQEAGEKVADLRVQSSALSAIDVPADRAPSMIDEYPILAIAAARGRRHNADERACGTARERK